eukprot:4155824-Pleurochrysis_carterae.AAC.1
MSATTVLPLMLISDWFCSGVLSGLFSSASIVGLGAGAPAAASMATASKFAIARARDDILARRVYK